MAAKRTRTVYEVVSDDLNLEAWSAMMKSTLTEKGLWDVVVKGIPPDPTKIPELAATLQVEQLCRWRELVRKDMKALQILQSGLTDSVFKKTLSAASAKDLWDMLQQVPEHHSLAVCFADMPYDSNMWMIFNTTTNHMTPYEEYFTTLDRTRRARVSFIDGSSIMAQGTGDVRILTKEGTTTIKNVLFVPGIKTNALSVGQMSRSGYAVNMGTERCTIRERETGRLFGETMWEERGFFLRLQVIKEPVRRCGLIR